MSSGGGSQNTKTTTTTQMSPEQKALFAAAKPFADQYIAGGGAPAAPTQTVAGFNPTQIAGQEQALAAGGTQGALGSQGANTANYILGGGLLLPGSNPALQSTIDYGVSGLLPAYNAAMGQIRGEANTTGNFGSSRQGIAEGITNDALLRNAGGIASQIATQGYEAALPELNKTLALLPQTQMAQTAQAGTTSAVGEAQQQQTQAELDAANAAQAYNAQRPLISAQQLLGLIGQTPGGSSTATAAGPTTSPTAQALGYGLTGLSTLGSLLPFLA